MVKTYTQEKVTTTPKELISTAPDRTSVWIHNLGTDKVYIGSDNQVSTITGFPIVAGQSITIARAFGDDPTLPRWFIASSEQIVAINEEFEIKKEAKE